MEIEEMQSVVDEWIQNNTQGYWEPSNMMLRIMEEVGELSREINHKYGEKPKKEEDDNEIGYEIADIIFALLCLSNSLDVDLGENFHKVLEKYEIRDKERFKEDQ